MDLSSGIRRFMLSFSTMKETKLLKHWQKCLYYQVLLLCICNKIHCYPSENLLSFIVCFKSKTINICAGWITHFQTSRGCLTIVCNESDDSEHLCIASRLCMTTWWSSVPIHGDWFFFVFTIFERGKCINCTHKLSLRHANPSSWSNSFNSVNAQSKCTSSSSSSSVVIFLWSLSVNYSIGGLAGCNSMETSIILHLLRKAARLLLWYSTWSLSSTIILWESPEDLTRPRGRLPWCRAGCNTTETAARMI